MATTHLVLATANGPVATLTLNNPDKANVLSRAMMDALEAALQQALDDNAIRVIVIAAAGRLFCAGHDLAELNALPGHAERLELFQRCTRLMLALRQAPKPVIAKVQGTAVAAGCQLVAMCDLAYAAERAKFGVNGIDLGLFCATPSVALSRAIPPRQALELALTGKLITAPQAVAQGLINAAVPEAELDGAVAEVAARIAAKDPQAIALGKANFWHQQQAGLAEAYALAAEAMADNLGLGATHEKIASFLKR